MGLLWNFPIFGYSVLDRVTLVPALPMVLPPGSLSCRFQPSLKGMNMHPDPYAPPSCAALVPRGDHSHLYVVSVRKFLVLSLLTNGLYSFYWYYRHWHAWNRITGASVIPWLRSLFAVFFIWSLFTRIDLLSRTAGQNVRWSPRLRATGLILLAVLSPATVYLQAFPVLFHTLSSLMLVLMTLLTIRVQVVVNHAAGDSEGLRNARYDGANMLWIGIGLLFWAAGIMLPL